MCGAPAQAPTLPPHVDISKETVIYGTVASADGSPIPAAYVRLLDGTGEFTAEVVTSATGDYRFFAAPGSWTVRALSRSGNGQADVSVGGPGLYTTEVSVG